MRALLITLKEPSRAKQRLAPLLSQAERSELAWAMFEDVAEAVCRWHQAGSAEVLVCLVTSSERAAHRAAEMGWEVLREQGQQSESDSVDWASGELQRRGVQAVLRLPADIPLLQPSDIDEILLRDHERRGALLVPSGDGLGTNALLRRPPDLFPSRFGPGSLALHRAEAARAGAPCRIHPLPRVALDVDEPADLLQLLSVEAATRSQRLLAGWQIGERTGRHDGA